MLLHEILWRCAARNKWKNFIFSENEKVTYEEAFETVRKVASGLRSLGVEKGDPVCMFASNSVRYILAMFGVFMAGGVSALIDPLHTDKLVERVNFLKSKILMFSGDLLSTVKEKRGFMSNVNKFIAITGSADFAINWDNLTSMGVEPVDVDLHGDDPCHLAYTSGTTYLPKPAVLPHGSVARSTRCIAERLKLTDGDTTLGITTLSSSHILVYGILPQMHVGASVGVIGDWNTGKAWEIIHKERVKVVSGTAVKLGELVDEALDKGIDKGSLKFVLSGGSAASRRLREKWAELGVELVETYGMSELGGSAALWRPGGFKYKPVKPFDFIPPIGPPPCDREVKIIDERGVEVPVGEIGEIIVGGGHMWGYWGMPKETAKAARDGWLHTDDIGYVDEYGNVYWLARKTEVIFSGKKKIYPRVIEEILYSHSEVEKAAVIPVKDERLGQAPKAYVTLKGKVTAKELLALCKNKLPSAYIPKELVILEEMPLTPTGKINKSKLMQLNDFMG